MKTKISVSITQENVKKLELLKKRASFRNKSHIMEYALEKLYEELKDEK